MKSSLLSNNSSWPNTAAFTNHTVGNKSFFTPWNFLFVNDQLLNGCERLSPSSTFSLSIFNAPLSLLEKTNFKSLSVAPVLWPEAKKVGQIGAGKGGCANSERFFNVSATSKIPRLHFIRNRLYVNYNSIVLSSRHDIAIQTFHFST